VIVHIDKAPLVLCFTNILKNAIRYSNEWGNIEVYIQKKYFKIKDYGIGISKDNVEKIFERYFRETYAGQWTWIGLSLVKKITDTYKWEVKVDSVKWEYTEIKLSF
jgi:signal transduction histidine kinase